MDARRRRDPAPAAVLSRAEVRALALQAQGFGARSEMAEPIDVLDRLGAIQLDSVSVLARPQDLVPFSRFGRYPVAGLHDAVYRGRRGFEYWGHEASWLPMGEYRYFRPRMALLGARVHNVLAANRDLMQYVLDRIRAEGALSSAAFEDPRPQRGTWWDWKPAKRVLEALFAAGRLMCAGRTAGFARLYDVPERVLPPEVDTTDPGEAEATCHLLRRAFGALGVAAGSDAAEYYRLRPAAWRPALETLVRQGELVTVAVEGEPSVWYARPPALEALSAKVAGAPEHPAVLLSPFDNLLWSRSRIERLFGYRFRIELYVPAPLRRYGYYVLPLLVRGRLAGRADLKLDRAAGRLRARGVWLEGCTPEEAAGALQRLARHLGATSVEIERLVRGTPLADDDGTSSDRLPEGQWKRPEEGAHHGTVRADCGDAGRAAAR